MRVLTKAMAMICALAALFALGVPAALMVPAEPAGLDDSPASDVLTALDDGLVLAADNARAAFFEKLVPIIPGENSYYGSRPAAGVYVTQTRKHTCTLIACTMMLRNYANLRGGSYETFNENLVGKYAWSKAYGLAQHFNIGKLEVSSTPEIRYEKDKKQYLIDKLREHPEGIVIYDTGAPHAIYLFGYDEAMDVFYCADTITSRGGRPIRLERSIIRGETQEDKLRTIDKIWFIVDKDGVET